MSGGALPSWCDIMMLQSMRCVKNVGQEGESKEEEGFSEQNLVICKCWAEGPRGRTFELPPLQNLNYPTFQRLSDIQISGA